MVGIRRRTLLKAIAVGSLAAPVVVQRIALARTSIPSSVLGYSQMGLPLVVHHVKSGDRRVLILGGQHGGPEANTIELSRLLLEYYVSNPGALPSSVGLDILPEANPDGAVLGARQYMSGVDPNRNWGGSDWQPDAYDSNGRYRLGLGGPEPFSEQETRLLADWILESPPTLVVNYHSQGGFMFGGGSGLADDVAVAYSSASGYPRPTASGGGSPLSYRATGSMNPWLRQNGIISIFVELSTSYAPEFERNLAGLEAALERIGAA